MVKHCCSIIKVNGNEKCKVLDCISCFYFFSFFAINSFTFKFAVALDLAFMWMKYKTTMLQIGSDWDQSSFRSISRLILWKGNCCYVIGLLWTWNRCFVLSTHLCGFILYSNKGILVHRLQYLIVYVTIDFLR